MFMFFYEAFIVPYLMCWNVPEVSYWAVGGWCMRIFWTIDLALSFFTGYWENRLRLELRLRFTATHYLRTFFPLDFSLVVWDWVSLLSPGLRVMRSMRLVRLGRQTRRAAMVVYKLKGFLVNRESQLLLDIAIIIIGIFWIMHVWCCIWYFIGLDVEGSDTGSTWLAHLRSELEAGSGYEYATSLHWSVTQITPGSMEVVPESTRERCFNVVVLFISLIMGTSLVANIAAMLTQYRIHLESTTKDSRMLQAYLVQSGASPGLTMAIKKQVFAKLRHKAQMNFNEVTYLSWADRSLQDALWCQVCIAHLEPHPFWSAWGRMDTTSLVIFCNKALRLRSYLPSAIVFEEGQYTNEMNMVVDGELVYTPGQESVESMISSSSLKKRVDLRLRKGAWCTEVALWVKWDHRGTMHCARTSDILCMDVSDWECDFFRFPEVTAVLIEYGRVFLKGLQGNACSDLAHSQNTYELISEVSLESRLKMSAPLLEYLGAMRSSTVINSGHTTMILDPFGDLQLRRLERKKLAKLQEEVVNGKCDIGIVDRELTRFIFVVALRILAPQGTSRGRHAQRQESLQMNCWGEGPLLVNVGVRTREGTVKVGMQLPGSKRRENESCEEAVERVIRGDLIRIAPVLKWSSTVGREVDIFFKESPTIGVPTRYSRTIFMGILRQNLDPFKIQAPFVELEPEPTRLGRVGSFGSFWHRQTLRAEEESQLEAIRILTNVKEVIVLPDSDEGEGGYALYVWLHQEEFDALSEESAKPVVQKWASAVCAHEQDSEHRVFDTFL